jgi:ferredoxin
MNNRKADENTHIITVRNGSEIHKITVQHGANLRRSLLDAGLSPYASLTKQVNCGGRGLCATCGVWIESDPVSPKHWHDRLATQFGYPRLSCQITVESDMETSLILDKWVWGRRDPSRKIQL